MGGGATQAVLNDAENEGAFGVLTMAPAMQVRQSGTGAVRHVGERGMHGASGISETSEKDVAGSNVKPWSVPYLLHAEIFLLAIDHARTKCLFILKQPNPYPCVFVGTNHLPAAFPYVFYFFADN